MKTKLISVFALLLFFNLSIMAQNPTLESIFNRTSIRAYSDKPVSVATLTLLVKAGMAAPSGMNRQPWEFMVTQDKKIMAQLSESLPYAKMLKDAQAAIIVIGDPEKSDYWYLDCSAAAENILLAAHSLGLGAVWTASFPYEKNMTIIAKALSIPLPYRPLCLIPIGYPKNDNKPKDKWNPSKLHMNKW